MVQWGKAINSSFQQFSASIKKNWVSMEDWAPGYNSMKFWDFPDLSQFSRFLSLKLFWQLVRQLVYTTFVNNNHTSSHLWWKENLVKYQKAWNYFVHNCLQNFLLLFIFLLTAPMVKNSHIFAGIYFIF